MQYSSGGNYGSSATLAPAASFDSNGRDVLVPSMSSSSAPFTSTAPSNGYATTSWPPASSSTMTSNHTSPPSHAVSLTPSADTIIADIVRMLGPRANENFLANVRNMPYPQQVELRNQVIKRVGLGANKSAEPSPPTNASPHPQPTPAQSMHILKRMQDYNTAHGHPFEATPLIDGRPVDNIANLFIWVIQRGGSQSVSQQERWGEALAAMGFPPDAPQQPGAPPFYSESHRRALAQIYTQLVGPYEAQTIEEVRRKKLADQAVAAANGPAASSATTSTPVPAAAVPAPAADSTPVSAAGMASPASLAKGKVSAEPPSPKKRKRQRVEYVPVQRQIDTLGGWNLQHMDEIMHKALQHRRPRGYADLGLVDIYSLNMAIRSRIPSELSFALNTLKILADGALVKDFMFRVKDMGDLLNDLVELFEETAFAATGDSPPSIMSRRTKSRHSSLTTYERHVQAAIEVATQLRGARRNGRTREAAARSDLLLSLTNLFRVLAGNVDNQMELADHPRLTISLLRACACGDQAADDMGWLSIADLLVVRKDVLHTAADLGFRIRLSSPPVAASALSLFRFFVFEFVGTPHTDQQYVDTALILLAKAFVIDANRAALSRAHAHSTDLVEQLVRSLPLTDQELQLQILNNENLVMLQMTVLAIFNLAFVGSPAQRARLRSAPGVASSLMRMVRRMMAYGQRDASRKSIFDEIMQRCLATLTLLNDDGHGGAGGDAVADSHGPWFGSSRTLIEEAEDEDGKAKVVDENDFPPLFVGRGKIELYQFATLPGLDHATHDALLSLYERQPVKPRS